MSLPTDLRGRRIPFAVLFAILGALAVHRALISGTLIGQILCNWGAANLFVWSLGYLMNWPGIFGKSQSGKLSFGQAALMAPALLGTRGVWIFQNTFFRSPQFSEVISGVYVGRLCQYKSLPAGVDLMVDLTAEFPTPRSIRTNLETICIPTLDCCPPDWDQCQQAFKTIGTESRRIYVCCANGHGRSVTFVAAWLGYRQICRSADEAIRLIQTKRPLAKPDFDQVRFLEQAYRSFKNP